MSDKSMRVLFIVYDNESHISFFQLGIGYLASAARDAGHSVTIYNQDVYHYTEAHLTEYLRATDAFDFIGISACGGYYQYRKVKSLCEAVRAADTGAFLALGGHLTSPDPEYFLRTFHCDALCIGEGEITIVEMLRALANGDSLRDVKGIAYLAEDGAYVRTEARPLIDDIDSIAMPAYDLFPIDHYALLRLPNIKSTERCMPLLSGRGCTFTCNFCYRMDKGFRARTPAAILKEIHFLIEKYNIRYFGFADELLMTSVKRTTELCEAFIASGLKFHWDCCGRLNYATPEVLDIMKRAGCVFINYGIESVNDAALKNMNKALTVKQIIAGVEATLSAGISPGLNIIFGNIGEDAECLKNDVEFLLKYDDHSQLRTIRPVTPYPGSPLFDLAVEKGLIKDIGDFYENKHTNSDLLTVNFTNMTDEEFYAELHKANKILLDNYVRHLERNNLRVLDDLYLNRDAGFRGFRHA